MSDFNQHTIEEFRSRGGEVGGVFEGKPLLLLHHRGAKTGTKRVSPLMYQRRGDDIAIFASKGGAPTNPDWYHNLLAYPETSIEIGTEVVDVMAREATGEEREEVWERQKQEWPHFAGYEERTTRHQIPVVILETRS